MHTSTPWLNVAIVAQSGRIGYQALLCAASIRSFHAPSEIRIFVCIPRNSNRWTTNPEISDADLERAFARYACEVIHFENLRFGSDYPHSNKFYAMLSIPSSERFLFLDSDTIVTGALSPEQFNFDCPALRPATVKWPVPGKSAYTTADIWESLYRMFELDPAPYFLSSHGRDSTECYPYYSGSLIYHSQAEPFGRTMLRMAERVWGEPPGALGGQRLKPWLDQIVLPLALARFGTPRVRHVDPVRKSITHYQFPFYLVVRYENAVRKFAELSFDRQLISVLMHDTGFRYYLSEEGRELVGRTHSEFLNSEDSRNYRAFKDLLRARVPLMR